MIYKNSFTPESVAPDEAFLGVSDKISFRQIAVLAAMHAILSRKPFFVELPDTAIEIADKLIAALEKKEKYNAPVA